MKINAAMTPSSLGQRTGLALFAILQNSLVGGLVYGWASIDRTLLVSDAKLSFDETTTIFSLASSVGMFSSLLMGPVLDMYGPRYCSLLAHAIVGTGCALFAVAHSFVAFLIATILISFGGPGIQLSIVHICNLFPSNQYFALSSINGSISFSFLVFVAFGVIWEATDISFRALFGAHALIVYLSMILSWFVWPDRPYDMPPSPKNYYEPTIEDQLVEAMTAHRHSLATEQPLGSFLREGNKHLAKHHSFAESRKAIDMGDELLISLKDMPFLKQLTSGSYVRAVLTFLITCFLANLHVASISTELADVMAFNTREQHELTQLFTVIVSSGLVASFFVGWLMDQVGLEVCTALTLLLGQIQAAALVWLASRRSFLVASFVCYMCFRSFLFPVFIASITTHLGYKYFGLLNGIGFALAGVAQAFMSYAVFLAKGDCHFNTHVVDVDAAPTCDHGRWVTLHFIELIVLTVLLAVPILDYMEKVTHKMRVREVLGSIRSLNETLMSLKGGYGSFSDSYDEGDGLNV